MQKGTNYAIGPQAWAETIGHRRVRSFLIASNRTLGDGRYELANLYLAYAISTDGSSVHSNHRPWDIGHMKESHSATEILASAARGDPSAGGKLLPLVYDDLRLRAERLMRHERQDHTLQATALVHEAFLKLVDQSRVDWQGRTHFLAVAAVSMRQLLVDHARRRNAAKRGGGQERLSILDELIIQERSALDVLALDTALEKLSKLDSRAARVVELRFFGGMTELEVAAVLEVSERTVRAEWSWARTWLRRELGEEPRDES